MLLFVAKIFVVGTKVNLEERDSVMTSKGSCDRWSSEIYFFTNRITSPSATGALEDPWLMLLRRASGTSAGQRSLTGIVHQLNL